MCIAAWVWQDHHLYPFILLLNRDEDARRPTEPVSWWKNREILGGRDIVAGGTWLACSKDGRLAFLTNFLEVDVVPNAKSRGELPVRFLENKKTPLEYANEIAKEKDLYNGFNLVVADFVTKSMAYVSNRPKENPLPVKIVSPGLHVLSNATLDTPWHKSVRLGRNFKKMLPKHGDVEISLKQMVDRLMKDTDKADKHRLPKTGVDSHWEHELSSIFVDTEYENGRYCTRSMIGLSVNNHGEVSFYEKYLEDEIWKEHTINFQIESFEDRAFFQIPSPLSFLLS